MKFSVVVVASVSMAALVSGCTKSRTGMTETPSNPTVPTQNGQPIKGETIDAGSIPQGQARPVRLSNGADIVVQNLGGTLFFQVEGTFGNDSFDRMMSFNSAKPVNERNAILGKEIDKVLARIGTVRGLALSQAAEVGYFSFMLPYQEELMAALKPLKFDHSVLLNPVVFDRDSLKQAKSLTPSAEGLVARSSARGDTSNFSGLARIGAPEFSRIAEADIGGDVKVNGSSVNVGITDTGITLNHPTFLSGDRSHNRVAYLKDFSREGRIYFNPKAKFTVTVPAAADGADESDLTIDAQVILTPKIPALPAGDVLADVNGLDIKVSPELKAILTTAGSGAKLGILNEDAFQGETEKVDINHNGKLDDKLLLILIPGVTADDDVVYFDPTGTGDFRQAKAMHTWNKNKDTVSVFAEKFGFDIEEDKLPGADGTSKIAVRSASVVGFDPGNHGSHVSGIAAGSRTLRNDAPDTLARGVAPEATISLDRVCANNGGCNATEAMIDLALKGNVEVINMSLGGLSPFNDGYGVQETLVNRITAVKNVLFVISAGNSGPGRQTIGSPSTARLSLSVGASASKGLIERQYEWPGGAALDGSDADNDFMLFFSSRGPTAAGGFKPNLAAPGTELSSVQLNTAPGGRGGLDVYWGTSMAAPTATGAYALFLDGIKKYNLKNPQTPLPTDALTLRRVLIESARPFDMSSFDTQTGAKTAGQYTWIDEGKGIIDLPAAWKMVMAQRDSASQSAVLLDGKPVELDYQVLVSSKNPNGIAYDGSRAGLPGVPAFGEGIYLDFYGTETLRAVHIQRNLPEGLASGPQAGDLTAQLETTRDEFVLKTVIYGSDKNWIKAGTLDQLNCAASDTANLSVMGRGADIETADDGTGTINPFNASTLNICINRAMIANELPQGDNGALISAYRVVNGAVAPVPAFTVPVYVTVPHKTLVGSASYETEQSVNSFGVSRNYVTIPKGTSVVRVSLEVPALKRLPNGLLADGQECSGIEMMAYEGANVSKPFATRQEARIGNCDSTGAAVSDAKRKLVFSSTNPTPGVWDLHIFGSYKYAHSKFKMRVDYVTATASVKAIEGSLAALNGSLTWTIKETSMSVSPDSAKSALELVGLNTSTPSQVKKGESVNVVGPLGVLRTYPAGTKSVVITTGGSPGNDIDLTVMECPTDAPVLADYSNCDTAGTSGGSDDNEKVKFEPKDKKAYVVHVDGFDIKDEGKFVSTETISFDPDKGGVTVTGDAPVFNIAYAMTAEQLAASKLASSPLFTSGKYGIVGALTLRTSEEIVLDSIPVTIAAPVPAPSPASTPSPVPAAR